MTVHTTYLTGQRRIPANRVAADVTVDDTGALHVAVSVDSAVRGRFPDDYTIVVEAYTRGRVSLFTCGTTGTPDTAPRDVSDTFPGTAGIRLRVMIVDKFGRIAGSCDGITPVTDDDDDGPRVEGFLRLEPVDLGARVYKVETDDLIGPTLFVHEDVIDASGSRASWVQAPSTKAYVLPAVCEAALRWAGSTELEDDEPGAETAKLWLRWAQLLAPADPRPDDSEDLESWVATVTDAFCREHRFLDELVAELEDEE